VTPLEWFTTPAHYQGLCLAYGVTLMAAACSIVLNGATWSTGFVGVTAAFLFTTISLPLCQIYWNLHWPWWLIIAMIWGVVSVLAMRSLIRAAQRVYERTPDIVDGGISRIQPSTPGGRSNG
jgi:hypothetical protein